MREEETHSIEKTAELCKEEITDMFREAITDQKVANDLYEMLHKHFASLVRTYKRRHGLKDSLPTDDPIDWTFAKLLREDPDKWANRRHIIGTAAIAMQNIVHNHWRAKKAIRRGGNDVTYALSGSDVQDQHPDNAEIDLISSDLFTELDKTHPRCSEIVILKHHGRSSYSEISELLDCEKFDSAAKVRAGYRKAINWLMKELDDG